MHFSYKCILFTIKYINFIIINSILVSYILDDNSFWQLLLLALQQLVLASNLKVLHRLSLIVFHNISDILSSIRVMFNVLFLDNFLPVLLDFLFPLNGFPSLHPVLELSVWRVGVAVVFWVLLLLLLLALTLFLPELDLFKGGSADLLQLLFVVLLQLLEIFLELVLDSVVLLF